jgi:hypothetical protein
VALSLHVAVPLVKTAALLPQLHALRDLTQTCSSLSALLDLAFETVEGSKQQDRPKSGEIFVQRVLVARLLLVLVHVTRPTVETVAKSFHPLVFQSMAQQPQPNVVIVALHVHRGCSGDLCQVYVVAGMSPPFKTYPDHLPPFVCFEMVQPMQHPSGLPPPCHKMRPRVNTTVQVLRAVLLGPPLDELQRPLPYLLGPTVVGHPRAETPPFPPGAQAVHGVGQVLLPRSLLDQCCLLFLRVLCHCHVVVFYPLKPHSGQCLFFHHQPTPQSLFDLLSTDDFVGIPTKRPHHCSVFHLTHGTGHGLFQVFGG